MEKNRLEAEETKMWLEFVPISRAVDGSIETSEWCDLVLEMRNDFREALSLPADRFWTMVEKNPKLHISIASFLQNSPRPQDLKGLEELLAAIQAPDGTYDNFWSLYSLVFLVCLRMSTKKEMPEATKSRFGDVLYDNFAFDIPKMFDLCAIYGSSNHSLLTKMIGNIFAEQPKYTEDLENAIEALGEAFERVTTQVHSAPDDGQSLCEDLVCYFVDTATTLQLFVDIYQPSAQLFYKMEVIERIASFYDSVVPRLDQLTAMQRNAAELRKHLRRGRIAFLKLFRDLVTINITRPILENRDEEKVQELLDFLQLVLPYRAFVADYERCFPVWDDLDMLQQSGINVDQYTLTYINDGYTSAAKEYTGGNKSRSSPPAESSSVVESTPGPSTSNGSALDYQKTLQISQVQDLMPELGAGFVEACLDYYNNSVDQVVNALFEDNLPPHLAVLDRCAERSVGIPPANGFEDIPEETPVDLVDQRLDKKGRKGNRVVKKDEMKEFIENKQSKAEIKELISKYSSIDTEGSVYGNMGPMTQDEYDDEYDDTYDSQTVGKLEPDSGDEEPTGGAFNKNFVTPRILQPRPARGYDDDNEGYDQEASGSSQKPDFFVENPEVVRQRMEERRQSQYRGRGRGHAAPPRERDVVGKPKGQGQEKDVLINRRHKMLNKGGNQKFLSDKKRGF